MSLDVPSSSSNEATSSQPTSAATPAADIQPHRGFLASFSAGASGGLVASVFLQPLDVIKTYQQGVEAEQHFSRSAIARQAETAKTILPCASRAHIINPMPISTPIASISATAGRVLGASNSLATARLVVHERGIAGLWSGLGPSVLRSFFGPGLYFALLEVLVENTRQRQGGRGGEQPLSPMSNFMCSAVARGSAGLLLNPVSVIKTRFEWQGRQNTSSKGGLGATLRGLAEVGRNEGVRGLMSGAWPTLIRDVPFSGIFYVVYNNIMKPLVLQWTAGAREGKSIGAGDTNRKTEQDIPWWACAPVTNGVSAMAAGATATLITHPADVVKTRAQLLFNQQQLQGANARASSWTTVRRILEDRGPRGLFTGLMPRLLRRPLSVSIVWVVFEQVVPLISTATKLEQ